MIVYEVPECEMIPEGVSCKILGSQRKFFFRRGRQLIKVILREGASIACEEVTLPTEEEMNKLYRGE